jgi:hypothetical protein
MTREEAIRAVAHCVLQDRNDTYGSPENNFASIAELWSCFLDVEIAPHQVAVMMALMKIARLKFNPTHADSWVDLAGYAVCGAEVSELLEAKGV